LNDPCQTTSRTDTASRTAPIPSITRFFMQLYCIPWIAAGF
jgi:hypothetical protein